MEREKRFIEGAIFRLFYGTQINANKFRIIFNALHLSPAKKNQGKVKKFLTKLISI